MASVYLVFSGPVAPHPFGHKCSGAVAYVGRRDVRANVVFLRVPLLLLLALLGLLLRSLLGLLLLALLGLLLRWWLLDVGGRAGVHCGDPL